jgi:hypothetical protein
MTDRIKSVYDEVTHDLNYVKNFVSTAEKAKPAPNYMQGTIIKKITSIVYPQIYAYLVQNYSKEEAIRRLREMGARSAKYLYAIYPKPLRWKKKNFADIFKEIGRHSAEIVKVEQVVKVKKEVTSFYIKKYRCVFCTETPRMENVPVPYCYPSVAFFQNYYNIRSFYLGSLHPRFISIDVEKTAEHDKDYCLYRVEASDFYMEG